MSRFGTEYQVSKPTGTCAATGGALEPGMACIATLCERVDDDGFERLDYSLEAWQSGARPQRLFSYWRTTIPEPGGRRKLLVDDEVLLDLFERLEGDERPQRIALRFVLALILMRKRLLRFDGRIDVAGDEPERWRFRRKGSSLDDPMPEVVNPQLGDGDVLEISAELSEVLQGEW